jgi:hypothetical protein
MGKKEKKLSNRLFRVEKGMMSLSLQECVSSSAILRTSDAILLFFLGLWSSLSSGNRSERSRSFPEIRGRELG